jgi:hypothetical protein
MSDGMATAVSMGRDRARGGAAPALLRMAGYCAIVAVAMLVAAGIALALFFGDVNPLFGPVNDVFTALALLLMVPVVLAVWRLAEGTLGSWFGWLSLATIAGLVVAAAGFVMLVAGVIDLQASFITGGLGMLPFLVWAAALAYASLRRRVVSTVVGWWIVAFMAVTVASFAAAPIMSMALLSVTLAPALLVTLAGWLIALGRDLLRRSESRPSGAPGAAAG